MKNGRLLALTLAAALLLSIGAPALADTIKIGGLAPLTGAVAQYGIAVKNGVDLYVEQLNAAGGINGDTVEMVWYDEKGDEVEAINAFNLLVNNDKVVGIIGDVTSRPTLAVAERVREIGIPMITASATSYDVTTDNPSIFRSCFLDPFQASIMADFARDALDAKKVAVIYDIADDYSLGLAEAFRDQAIKNGQEVVAYESGTATDVDFSAQLTSIAAKEPDALFVAYYYGPAALIVQQAAKPEIGLDCYFLGADGIAGIEATISDTSLLDGKFFYSDHFATDSDDPAVQDFIKAYEAKYNEPYKMAFNATGYDAVLLLCEAIKAAGSTDYADVTAALKASDNVQGVTSAYTFDDHNDPIKSAYIMTFVDGKQSFKQKQEP
ncbi:MAG: ABC transporter substrate-binding protein [Oscillospiraceae bacterium]|jgi:branched-chain amino acid transport system substrate-binding protein|nr:ABC transporter substrate-binding protein [Oscillospiraceae bacterium]